MTKQLLVCLEGSRSSDRAVDLALALAPRLDAALVGLAIIDEPDIRAGEAIGIGGSAYKQQRDEALVKDAEAQSLDWLNQFVQRCEAAGVAARPIARRGRPADVILAEAEQAALTFMGADVNFRFETEAHDRETRDRVLHRLRRPIVLVPGTARPPGEGPVLIAYDGSSAAKRAVESFVDSGLHRTESPVHVVTAGDDGAHAWEIAERAVKTLAQAGIRATPHSLVSPLTVADAILKERARMGAWLLVSGAYHGSRFSELLWGSVTRALIEKTEVPLFLHH